MGSIPHAPLLTMRLCLFVDQTANALKAAGKKCLGQMCHEGNK